ncbi:MAG: membrane protein of unknown function [Promethearchaeota archaeon]|nr:MAG: membrane protein of unknown function [Candidatus Lokiarchaeota archaeon]
MKHFQKHIPNLLSIFRILISPLLFYSILIGDLIIGVVIYLYCICSDWLDGYLARKYSVSSSLGGYLDVFADFSFIFLALSSFVLQQVYPHWILILVSLIFLQFLLTSTIQHPVYDPLGKYYGSFLMLVIGIGLIDSQGYITQFIPMFLLGYSCFAFISRMLYLKSAIFMPSNHKESMLKIINFQNHLSSPNKTVENRFITIQSEVSKIQKRKKI